MKYTNIVYREILITKIYEKFLRSEHLTECKIKMIYIFIGCVVNIILTFTRRRSMCAKVWSYAWHFPCEHNFKINFLRSNANYIAQYVRQKRGRGAEKERKWEKKIVTNGIEYKLSVRNGARYSFAYGTCSFTHPKPESMDEKYAVCLLSSFNSMNICNVVQWMRRGRKKKKLRLA